jgi:hypothetical protein
MDDILKEAKRLGIKFEEEIKEDLERLSELQELLRQAERQRVYLEEEEEIALRAQSLRQCLALSLLPLQCQHCRLRHYLSLEKLRLV